MNSPFNLNKLPQLFALFIILFCHFHIQGQNAESLLLPNCNEVKMIDFNVQEIIDKENRFLFQWSKDTLQSLFCFARRNKNLELEAISLYLLGHDYMNFSDENNSLALSLRYINKSIQISQQNNFTKSLLSAKEELCSALTSHEMLDEASICCKEFIDIAETVDDSTRIAEGYMLLGRVFREQKLYTASDSILNHSFQYLNDEASSNRIKAFVHLHLSNLKRNEGRFKESIDLARQGLEITKKVENQKGFLNALIALEIVLSKIELGIFNNEKEYELLRKEGEKQLWIKGQYFYAKGLQFEKLGVIDSAIVNYIQSINTYDKANVSIWIIDVSKNLFPLLKEKSELSERALDILEVNHQAFLNIEKRKTQNNLFKATYYELENEKNKSTFLQGKINNYNKFLALAIICILLLSLTGLLLYRQNKIKKTFNYELNHLNKKLIKSHEKVTESKKRIEEKSHELDVELKYQLTILSSFEKQLKKLEELIKNEKELNPNFRKDLLKMLDLNKNQDLVEAANLKFFEANKNFIGTLSSMNPQLTQNDLKLCLYLKMNLSTKEIAQLQYKSPESVKVARSRLRKKLNLDTSVKITAFLNSIGSSQANSSLNN